MLTLDTRLRIAADVLAQEVEGESVLLHLGRESYYGLNTTGTLVWGWLRFGASLQETHANVVATLDVEPAVAEADLLDLVQGLLNAGIVVIEEPTDQ